mmetsp:Transcript_24859/g.60535  ORF Transcript_24859/g.60535 Transcript_24859/m.60535 type:complete len:220 (-) Transcript_24859:196-855(-)
MWLGMCARWPLLVASVRSLSATASALVGVGPSSHAWQYRCSSAGCSMPPGAASAVSSTSTMRGVFSSAGVMAPVSASFTHSAHGRRFMSASAYAAATCRCAAASSLNWAYTSAMASAYALFSSGGLPKFIFVGSIASCAAFDERVCSAVMSARSSALCASVSAASALFTASYGELRPGRKLYDGDTAYAWPQYAMANVSSIVAAWSKHARARSWSKPYR